MKHFIVRMEGKYNPKKKNIGKPIPPYPNGWYIVCESNNVKPGETRAIDQSGHNIALFRGTNGKLYALHAYCAHLGANMGENGRVVKDKCLQCHFHGWLYDGDNGFCVGMLDLM